MSQIEASAPQAVPEPGWTPLTDPPDFGEGPSFISGDTVGNRLRVAYFLREADNALCAMAWFGRAAEGPPGHAHGGSIAAVLDEAMGIAAWIAGHPVVAASLTVQFRKGLPLGTDATVETRVRRSEGRKVYMQATLRDQSSKCVFAEAEGLYIVQNMDRFAGAKRLTDTAVKQGLSSSSPDD